MNRHTHPLEMIAAWVLALLWLAPLAYALWSSIHPAAYATSFSLSAPLTLENFARAWNQAPFARYYLNTVMLVTLILAGQLVLCTLAAYAFARFKFKGSGIAFALVLLQLMIMPDVLIVENYRLIGKLGLLDTIVAIGLPYMQGCSNRTRGSGACRRGERLAGAMESLCPARAPDLCGIWFSVGQLPLE
jgi:sn-glycerol 3-phosphate transport system permease protein